tara:strand:+ start:60836 stop:61336 length:501 start_codon:yes stop_codon:yes gene_type:complete
VILISLFCISDFLLNYLQRYGDFKRGAFIEKRNDLKFNLRNQIIAHIFATNQLQNNFLMKRDIFQAIADPTRRAILVLIAAQAMTPNALSEHFDISRQATSKHIQVLNECELLQQEKEGREIYYQLKIEKMKEVDVWLEQFRKIWENRFSQLDDLLIKLKSVNNER